MALSEAGSISQGSGLFLSSVLVSLATKLLCALVSTTIRIKFGDFILAANFHMSSQFLAH